MTDLIIEMADEIARLKADRDAWRTNYYKDIESLQKDVSRLTAELEKAREALERITHGRYDGLEVQHLSPYEVRQIAARALRVELKGKKE